MELKAGLQVGNVSLTKKLGEGGMGSVWIGHHATLNSTVAVKFITEQLTNNAQALARFKREAQVSAQIRSPHVVTILDHGVTPWGMPFIIMELLEGQSLGERLTEGGPLDANEAVTLVKQVGMALNKAHSVGVVHRDLKPDNIFLVDSGYDLFAKILDFGIAKTANHAVAALTGTSAVVGTAYYMSPEQLMSTKSVDHRADLWAFAVLLYESLTGQRPFIGETITSLAILICTTPHAPILDVRADLPPALEGFFEKAFAKDLTKRHSDIDDFVGDFSARSKVGELGGDAPPADVASANPRENPPVPAAAVPAAAVPAAAVPAATAMMDFPPAAATHVAAPLAMPTPQEAPLVTTGTGSSPNRGPLLIGGVVLMVGIAAGAFLGFGASSDAENTEFTPIDVSAADSADVASAVTAEPLMSAEPSASALSIESSAPTARTATAPPAKPTAVRPNPRRPPPPPRPRCTPGMVIQRDGTSKYVGCP